MLKKIFIIILIAGFSLFWQLYSASAEDGTIGAALYFTPDKTTFLDPDELVVDLVLDTGGQNANALLFGLGFDHERLELTDMNIDDSICPIVGRQSIDNTAGQAGFICGSPVGFNGSSLPVSRLTFRKRAAGFAALVVLGYSQVALSDGYGTYISLQRETHNFYIYK